MYRASIFLTGEPNPTFSYRSYVQRISCSRIGGLSGTDGSRISLKTGVDLQDLTFDS